MPDDLQKIAVELLPGGNRRNCVILVTSAEPIPASALIDSVEAFVRMMRDKFTASKIERVENKIIVP